MEIAFLNNNIVVIGSFKPANFDKLAFVERGILKSTDFDDQSVFTPEFSQIVSNNLLIQITPEKANFTFKEENSSLDPARIASLFENSTISAFGINFQRAIILDSENKSKDFFYFEGNKLNTFFDPKKTEYGYSVTQDFGEYRLTINFKPLQLQKVEKNNIYEALDASFNFHFNSSDLSGKLNSIKTFQSFTEEILNNFL